MLAIITLVNENNHKYLMKQIKRLLITENEDTLELIILIKESEIRRITMIQKKYQYLFSKGLIKLIIVQEIKFFDKYLIDQILLQISGNSVIFLDFENIFPASLVTLINSIVFDKQPDLLVLPCLFGKKEPPKTINFNKKSENKDLYKISKSLEEKKNETFFLFDSLVFKKSFLKRNSDLLKLYNFNSFNFELANIFAKNAKSIYFLKHDNLKKIVLRNFISKIYDEQVIKNNINYFDIESKYFNEKWLLFHCVFLPWILASGNKFNIINWALIKGRNLKIYTDYYSNRSLVNSISEKNNEIWNILDKIINTKWFISFWIYIGRLRLKIVTKKNKKNIIDEKK